MDYQKLNTVKVSGVYEGVWSLRHIPSGKVIIGITKDIAKQKRYQVMLLVNGKHKTPAFQELYNSTSDLSNFQFRFGITTDAIEQKELYDSWVKQAIDSGLYLTARKGKQNDSSNAIGRKAGFYIINFINTGLFYVGSSSKLKGRLTQHRSMLKHGYNTCRLLQEAYNHDPEYKVITQFTDTLEDARNLEQAYIDRNKGNPLLLNIATDVNAPCSNLHENPKWHQKIVDAAAKVKRSDSSRKSYGEKMKAYWATPEAKAKRMGGGNPFAKQVSVLGIVYGSVMDAVRSGVMSDAKVRQRLKDPDDKEVFYL